MGVTVQATELSILAAYTLMARNGGSVCQVSIQEDGSDNVQVDGSDSVWVDGSHNAARPATAAVGPPKRLLRSCLGRYG